MVRSHSPSCDYPQCDCYYDGVYGGICPVYEDWLKEQNYKETEPDESNSRHRSQRTETG